MLSEQGILNESAVPSGISDPAVAPAIDQPQVPATNVVVSSLPHIFFLKAKSRENQNFKDMLGRCELYIGIGYHLLASKSILIKEKVTNNDLALKSFKK